MTHTCYRKLVLCLLAAILLAGPLLLPARAQEVRVVSGLDNTIEWLESIDWWGEENRGEQLQVPHTMLVGISETWQKTAPQLTVPTKKEIFYRLILPLVVHANTMVLDRREALTKLDVALAEGRQLTPEETETLSRTALLLRIKDEDEIDGITSNDEWRPVIEEALYKLDVIPAGLALGQAAYESGYGTSRFAVEGNALFGQWTFGGEGLVPEQQRKSLGDHRIASYEWPFDSVRGYFLNLSSHPAYEDFRRMRAELKAAGKPLTSLTLADGLKSYSERGQEYVDDLKGIIRVNNLEVADNAAFRDEPIGFVLGAATEEEAVQLRARIEEMRTSGELEDVIARMRLD
jgi:Bax protein